MIARRVLITTLLACGVSVAQEQPQVCSHWQVTKLDQAPTWYLEALSAPPIYNETKIGDSLTRRDYVLNDSVTLVQYQHEQFEALNDIGRLDWFAPGSLYLYGRDTVLLDSNAYGFSELSFDGGKYNCVAKEVEYIGPDWGSSAIVTYYLVRRSKTIVHSHLLGVSPQYSPHYDLVAYTDFADLYVGSIASQTAELVFKRGGSYVQEGECRGRWIRDIRWSADGRSLVFKYFEHDVFGGDYEIWEVRLSPD